MSEKSSLPSAAWFDTPYYHILYKNRDIREAEAFIDRLNTFFVFKKGEKALDLACGRGRHSFYLHEKGLSVTGIDISPSNIAYAKRLETEGLCFINHDMLLPFPESDFDYIFNLFTSFGYFPNEDDDLKVLKNCREALKNDGVLLIDFLNVKKAVGELKAEEKREEKNILFKIRKRQEKDFIVKEITVEDEGQVKKFYEYVRMLDKSRFVHYMEEAGLMIERTFGNYKLEPFDEKSSDRLILICKKQS